VEIDGLEVKAVMLGPRTLALPRGQHMVSIR